MNNISTSVACLVVGLCVYFWLRIFPDSQLTPKTTASLPGSAFSSDKKREKRNKKKKEKKNSSKRESLLSSPLIPDTVSESDGRTEEQPVSIPATPILSKEPQASVETQNNAVQKKEPVKNRKKVKTPQQNVLSTTEFPPLVSSSAQKPVEQPRQTIRSDLNREGNMSGTSLSSVMSDESPFVDSTSISQPNHSELSSSDREMDDGWQIVENPGHMKTLRIVSSGSSSSTIKSTKPKPTVTVVSNAITKKQRENQRKQEKMKALKELQEKEQAARLQQHRLARERAQLEELARQESAKKTQRLLNLNTTSSVSQKPVVGAGKNNNFNLLKNKNEGEKTVDAGDLWG
ncbi:hypothetical protein HK098_000850 [Nowakowskiella sp. JEL0407]|nr:hypothetical protein HK098_000850 [Nowakowskiella sp. JEL0407]